MANEIQFDAGETGLTDLYCAIRNRSNQYHNGSAFESRTTITWDTEAKIALAEDGSSGWYQATFNNAIATGWYFIEFYQAADTTAVRLDDDLLTVVEYYWNTDNNTLYELGAMTADMVENDGGTLRQSANALEEAPTGSGSSPWSASEKDDLIADLAGVKAITDQHTFTGGKIDAQVGGMDSSVLTAAAFATDALSSDALSAAASNQIRDNIYNTQLPKSYAAKGVQPTFAQMQYMTHGVVANTKADLPGLSMEVYDIDGTTLVMTYTLDSADPTERRRNT